MVRVGIGLPDIRVIPNWLHIAMTPTSIEVDVKGLAILDVWRVALGIQAQMTEDVHVPPALLHDLTIGIASSLVPLKATNQLPKAVVMLSKLGVHRCDCRLLVQCWVIEQQQLPPVAPGSRLLQQLPTPPPSRDGNHLRFRCTLLHENLIVEWYDNRRYNGSRRSESLGNDLIMWRCWRAGHMREWGKRWSEEGRVIDKVDIGRHWN